MDRKGRNGGTLRSFEPGKSGNPAGRPKRLRHISEFLADFGLAQEVNLTIQATDVNGVKRAYLTKLTVDKDSINNQLIAFLLLQQAITGKIEAIREVLNHTEGRPPNPIHIENRSEVGATLKAWTAEEVDLYEAWKRGHPVKEPMEPVSDDIVIDELSSN